ncbi:hypothetical protein P3T24_006552 [Paraburkholderia sp. GAS33]|uniref:hypothetical protein n=1 Tax=Paraburkholderia sp. GAS33 TaxID=3035130 RepID=UPI003D25C12E
MTLSSISCEHPYRAHAGPQGRLLPASENVAGDAPARLDTPVILLDLTVPGDEYSPVSQRNAFDGIECGKDVCK